ncbi:DNRLRE domain-containing protein [bacterium]|nr:DNRLRE domain-containing protein [bacterium]
MSKSSLVIFSLLFIMFILYSGCTDKNGNPVGLDIFDRDQFGEEHSLLIQTSASDTFYLEPMKSGNSQYLLLGEKDNFKYNVIFRVDTSGYPENHKVDSAFIYLFVYNMEGDTNDITLPQVYESNASWEEDDITWEYVEENGLTGAEVNITPRIVNKDTISFKIPNDLVEKWMADDNEAFKGLILDYTNNGNIYSILSGDGSYKSYMKLHTTDLADDTTHSSRIMFFDYDAFVSHHEIAQDPDRLWVINGIGYRSYLNFDLSVIPENATINNALLSMTLDTLASWPTQTNGFGVSINALESDFDISQDNNVQSQSDLNASTISDSLIINVRSIVQEWARQSYENKGFLLKGQAETIHWSGRSFYSSTADSTKRPTLKIFYSIPPVTISEN